MNKRTDFAVRALVGGAFLALVAPAQADLKITATVSTSGTDLGFPTSGQYEVDYRPGLARVVGPNGQILIYDFTHSQVSTLDTAAKTYTQKGLTTALQPDAGQPRSATFARDPQTKGTTMFGAAASRFYIGDQGSNLNTNTGYGNRGRSRGEGSVTGAMGSAWVADASAIKSSVASVAPLAEIGVPHRYAASISQQIDQAGGIPISFSFSSNPSTGRATLSMQVTAVDAKALDASLFSIPADYKLVTAPIKK